MRRLGFGPSGENCNTTIALWECRAEDLHGNVAVFEFDVVPGSSPMLLGLDYDQRANTVSLESPAKWSVALGDNTFEFPLVIHRDSDGNLRRFVEFIPSPSSVTALLSTRRRQGAVKMAVEDPKRFARKLHGWSHYPVAQMRRLVKNAGLLSPEVDSELLEVVANCDLCPMTGSNISSRGLRRVSLSKVVDPCANKCVEIDHVSHVVAKTPTVREVLCLAMACQGTGFGETPPVPSKSLPAAVSSFELVWVCRHGAPEILTSDPGLAGGVMDAFCTTHSITWQTRPPRRHNTIGVVERRNGVMRMVLERLVSGNDSLPSSARTEDGLLLERANFLANLYVGNSVLSSFELFRGYLPSLVGMPTRFVSDADVEAHVQLSATRALSRMLRSKNFNPYIRPALSVGQIVYVHTRNRPGSARGSVGWAKHVVYKLDDAFVSTRPVGRTKGIMNKTSYADVRVPPKNPIAQTAFEFALQQPLARLGRCGDRAEPEDSADGRSDAEGSGDDSGDGPEDELATARTFYSRIEEEALTRAVPDVGDPGKDIGSASLLDAEGAALMKDDEQVLCTRILETIGRSNVTRSKLAFVPSWLLDNALEDELVGWDPYIQVKPLAGTCRRSVIGSHVLYCVKTREDGSHYLKSRLVLHGNQEADKEELRSDASSLHFSLLRLILSISTCLGLALGGVDVSKAYHQSGSPPRSVHVRPPPECMMIRCVWLLLSLPYGLVDAGRQWQLAMESWLLDDLGFTSFLGLPQVFALLNSKGQIVLLIGKISDDIIVAGKKCDIEAFFEKLHARWQIGKAVISNDLLFNGARIRRDASTGDVTLCMNDYVREKVSLLELDRARRKEPSERATDEEAKCYRSMAGTLNFLGTGALPIASFVASVFLQRQSNLLVYDLDVANKMLGEVMKMDASVLFRAPTIIGATVKLLGFSDASFNVLGGTPYGQSGFVAGLLFASADSNIFHPLDWCSSKQRRVVYSSFGAEILACADADNRLYGLKMGLSAMLASTVRSELVVDSRGLFTCITTLSDQREYRLRRTVARIRESFDSEELNIMRWVKGELNLADAPTKWNPASWKLLQDVFVRGLIPAACTRAESRGDAPHWRRNLPATLRHDC